MRRGHSFCDNDIKNEGGQRLMLKEEKKKMYLVQVLDVFANEN